jgi:hypothetical protein
MNAPHDIGAIARILLGEPNAGMSSKHELRFGTRGSVSVDLRKGVWFDHERGIGGGDLDLIEDVTGLKGKERIDWKRDHGIEIEGERRKPRPNGKAPLGKIVAVYPYVDENGATVRENVRFEPKAFRQRRPARPDDPPAKVHDGCVSSTKDERNVPYRLPELKEAIGCGHPIFIVEGERDADNVHKLGAPATCNIGGAGNWESELNEYFRDADVVVIPDNDPQAKSPKTGELRFHADGRPVLPGQDHAQDVCRNLTGIARRVRLLDLAQHWPEMPPKGDVSDWLARGGGTIERLWEIVEQLRDWKAPATGNGHDPTPAPQGPRVEPCTIDEAIAVFRKWLILTDVTPIYAVLGTVAANLLPGDPVWLGIIGPPSSAKTEILNSTLRLPNVVQAATFTPAGALSGTPKKQRDKEAKGGLLRRIGEFGIVVLKDFGSILSMRPDAKAEVLAALREIYDGAWTRHLGTDGGKELSWAGKLGLIFGATGVIDSHYSVIGAMGDRFLLSRLAPAGQGQFARALEHVGCKTGQMRKELAEAVARLFAGRKADPRPISKEEMGEIDHVITLVVRLRGAVERDRHSREIEAVYGAEGTARIGLALERLLAGLDTLGVDRATALGVVTSIAMDSVPPLRRQAFEVLRAQGENLTGEVEAIETSEVAAAVGLPTVTVRRALEDLAAYGLVERISQGKGKPDLWKAAQ